MQTSSFLITGTSRGLGLSIAKTLGSTEHVIEVRRNIKSEVGYGQIEQCDLSVVDDVLQLASRIQNSHIERVVLVCNAATSSQKIDKKTTLPVHMLCNALSHYYLALKLAESGKLASIISVSSTPGKIGNSNFDSMDSLRQSNYFTSKQIGLILLQHLAYKYDLPYFIFSPGPMNTRLVKDVLVESLPSFPKLVMSLLVTINSIFAKNSDTIAKRFVSEYSRNRNLCASNPAFQLDSLLLIIRNLYR